MNITLVKYMIQSHFNVIFFGYCYICFILQLIDPGDMCNPAASDTVAITYLSQLLSATLILPGNKFRKVLNGMISQAISLLYIFNRIYKYQFVTSIPSCTCYY